MAAAKKPAAKKKKPRRRRRRNPKTDWLGFLVAGLGGAAVAGAAFGLQQVQPAGGKYNDLIIAGVGIGGGLLAGMWHPGLGAGIIGAGIGIAGKGAADKMIAGRASEQPAAPTEELQAVSRMRRAMQHPRVRMQLNAIGYDMNAIAYDLNRVQVRLT